MWLRMKFGTLTAAVCGAFSLGVWSGRPSPFLFGWGVLMLAVAVGNAWHDLWLEWRQGEAPRPQPGPGAAESWGLLLARAWGQARRRD